MMYDVHYHAWNGTIYDGSTLSDCFPFQNLLNNKHQFTIHLMHLTPYSTGYSMCLFRSINSQFIAESAPPKHLA